LSFVALANFKLGDGTLLLSFVVELKRVYVLLVLVKVAIGIEDEVRAVLLKLAMNL
jgi:hypothetical protein